MSDLLPCPFCGGDVALNFIDRQSDDSVDVTCVWCHVHMYGFDGAESATSAWNRRSVYPEPNWATAPAWAQWWAVDARGIGLLYECEPVLAELEWWRVDPACRYQKAMKVDLPLGCDWRLTLRQRPEVTE